MNARKLVGLLIAATMAALLPAGCPSDTPATESKDSSATSAPRVDAVTPNHGPTSGGTRVTIIGGPFESQIGVLFGAHAAVDPVIVNSHMITANSPAQAAGLVDVTVLSDGGKTTIVGAFRYESNQVDIISISPSQGGVAGGTAVTITGQNFSPATLVTFGGATASSISVLSSQLITAVTPAHAAGWVRVEVFSEGTRDSLDPFGDPTTPADQLQGFRYFVPAVQVTSIEPAFGPIAGGTQVTIRGTMLPEGAGVLFGSKAATQVTYINDGLITAIAPSAPGEGPVDVTILYPGGQVVVPGGYQYTNSAYEDDGTDTDGDGVTDAQEREGWEVWIDSFGQASSGQDTYLNVLHYRVTSDPTRDDTDSDGLNDNVEFLIKSDPRKFDSDGDGLWDAEEWNQWLTSPTNIDTDGDSRGNPDAPLAPNQAIFDGLELFDPAVLRLPQGHPDRIVRARATSPTLSDTDGDGVSDFDEFDSTVRNGVISDLPRLDYRLIGDVDVRLNVQYAETIGETHEYGTTLTETESMTTASSFSSTVGWSFEIGIEQEIEYGPLDFGGTTFSFTAGVHGEYTWENSTESTKESSEEHSEVQSNSREMTETAADGSIRTAIIFTNPGNTTYTLTGLGVLVSQRETRKNDEDVSSERPSKAIATMTPVFDTVTLSPGETAGPFELAATGVNAAAIKELLAAPNSLLLDTVNMNFTDSNGLDFDYVRQFTIAQTAYIVIDFGDGEVRHYNVATNVDRNPDSTYRGIKMGRVMQEVLGLSLGDGSAGYTTMANPDPTNDRQVLRSLLGRVFTTRPDGVRRDYWITITNNPEHTAVDFNDMVLRAGDYVHLMYSRDDDGDGLSNTLEKALGSDQGAPGPDADLDGLPDKLEAMDGWIAFEDPSNPNAAHPDGFKKRRVYSSPKLRDSDGDGLLDSAEYAVRSDPFDPDSDGDGLNDGQDPNPTRRAGIRFVRAEAPVGGDGKRWDTAYNTIQRALLDAAGNPHANPADDVSQIWVARGTYKPSSRASPITLVNGVGIYGGFSGPDATTGFLGETKRGQRNTNAFTNGCVLSGDLSSNDTGVIDLNNVGNYTENCPTIVAAPFGATSATLLDGFMITGAYVKSSDGNNSALNLLNSAPTIQNCLIARNGSQLVGAGLRAGGSGSATFKKCILAGNIAKTGGAGYVIPGPNGPVVFEGCEFSQNEARRIGTNDDPSASGGAVFINGTVGRVDFNRCVFTGNQAWCQGGAIHARGGGMYVRIDSCRFYSNAITTNGGVPDWRGCGGAASLDTDSSVSNSVFWDNRSRQIGGAIAVISGAANPANDWWYGPVRRCTITNCTIVNNRAWILGGADSGCGVGTGGNKSSVLVQNSIAWGNYWGTGPLPSDLAAINEYAQIHAWDWQPNFSVNNCCLSSAGPTVYRGVNGNISDDPEINDVDLGDLRLGDDSPCVDRGSTFVDLDPLLPGLQQLPQFDLFGNPRLVDGNGDGIAVVDMGAFESPAARR